MFVPISADPFQFRSQFRYRRLVVPCFSGFPLLPAGSRSAVLRHIVWRRASRRRGDRSIRQACQTALYPAVAFLHLLVREMVAGDRLPQFEQHVLPPILTRGALLPSLWPDGTSRAAARTCAVDHAVSLVAKPLTLLDIRFPARHVFRIPRVHPNHADAMVGPGPKERPRDGSHCPRRSLRHWDLRCSGRDRRHRSAG
jgi:hypothetical protein